MNQSTGFELEARVIAHLLAGSPTYEGRPCQCAEWVPLGFTFADLTPSGLEGMICPGALWMSTPRPSWRGSTLFWPIRGPKNGVNSKALSANIGGQ